LIAGLRCFILSDCEGNEKELFDEATVEVLKQSDVLIEIHDDAYETPAHAVQTLIASTRSASNYPEPACLGGDAARAVAECRPARQRWLYASAR